MDRREPSLGRALSSLGNALLVFVLHGWGGASIGLSISFSDSGYFWRGLALIALGSLVLIGLRLSEIATDQSDSQP